MSVITGIVWMVTCFAVAKKVVYRRSFENSSNLATRSIRRGFFIVTLLLCLFFGVLGYIIDFERPSLFWIAACTGVVIPVFLGAATEITGNIILDSLLSSLVLVGITITAVNGLFFVVALFFTSSKSVVIWVFLCIGVAIVTRIAYWLKE